MIKQSWSGHTKPEKIKFQWIHITYIGTNIVNQIPKDD